MQDRFSCHTTFIYSLWCTKLEIISFQPCQILILGISDPDLKGWLQGLFRWPWQLHEPSQGSCCDPRGCSTSRPLVQGPHGLYFSCKPKPLTPADEQPLTWLGEGAEPSSHCTLSSSHRPTLGLALEAFTPPTVRVPPHSMKQCCLLCFL